MQKEFMWNLFAQTGNIDLYLFYKEYEEFMNDHKKINYNYKNEDFKELSLR